MRFAGFVGRDGGKGTEEDTEEDGVQDFVRGVTFVGEKGDCWIIADGEFVSKGEEERDAEMTRCGRDEVGDEGEEVKVKVRRLQRGREKTSLNQKWQQIYISICIVRYFACISCFLLQEKIYFS